jgi:hypothetical protein
MKRNTPPTRTSAALHVTPLRLSHYSIGRILGRRGDGLGIATALSVGALHAENMAQDRRRRATPAFETGGKQTRLPRPMSTSGDILSKNMGSLPLTLKSCAWSRPGAARYVRARQRGSLSTIATPRDMSAPSYARRVTPSSAGTKTRLTRSSSSKNTWASTHADHPCHADALLELANASAHLSEQGATAGVVGGKER